MPPDVALFLCFIVVAGLLWADTRRKAEVSSALWIPLIWMMILGSRLVSQWLDAGSLSSSLEEGNPVDAVVFSLLIGAGVSVLIRRRVAI